MKTRICLVFFFAINVYKTNWKRLFIYIFSYGLM